MLHDHEDGNLSQDLPHYYAPDPYLVPDSTIGGTSEAVSTRERPLSMTAADTSLPQTPVVVTAATKTSRKTGPLRPVNVVQHDDAGPSEWSTSVGEPETIELPPAYAHILPAQPPPGTASAPTTASIPAPTETTSS